MAHLYERYYELKTPSKFMTDLCDVLEVSLSYSKGGENYFYYTHEPRGFYLHMQPCKRHEHFKTYVPTEGAKVCVMEVSRFSNKKAEEAIANIDTYIEQYLANYCASKGYEISETYTD